ncbi:MAG TPA: DUF3027 domain-containing protein [Mycobacteriales bacterium]|nr:DUF3027 domain-containing protein [Mycobacteriales bacterium]
MTETVAPPHGEVIVDAAIELDAVGAEAIELARGSAEADAPGLVGEHLGFEADETRVVTHYFATLDPAYVGWRWAVTVARASRSKTVTVDDVVLLPGSEAVLAPEWVPWSERLRPGDLGAGDLLPTAADDPRLTPAYMATEDEDEAAISYEVGFGRERVMSYDGRLETVDRWYAGDAGPRADVARSAPAACATCGFFLPLAGGLRQAFGACGNAFAPDDGKVVAVDHGCGAHSEAVVVPVSPPSPPPLIDEAGYDIVERPTPEERARLEAQAAAVAEVSADAEQPAQDASAVEDAPVPELEAATDAGVPEDPGADVPEGAAAGVPEDPGAAVPDETA